MIFIWHDGINKTKKDRTTPGGRGGVGVMFRYFKQLRIPYTGKDRKLVDDWVATHKSCTADFDLLRRLTERFQRLDTEANLLLLKLSSPEDYESLDLAVSELIKTI